MLDLFSEITTCLTMGIGPAWMFSLIFFGISLVFASPTVFGLFYLIIYLSTRNNPLFKLNNLRLLISLTITAFGNILFYIAVYVTID